MPKGIPVRLSEALAARARAVAAVVDRSITEQVEHWARLGQVVEAVISAGAVERLKTRSFDPRLPDMLASADTAAGKARAARVIRDRNPVRFGIDGRGGVVKLVRRGKPRKAE